MAPAWVATDLYAVPSGYPVHPSNNLTLLQLICSDSCLNPFNFIIKSPTSLGSGFDGILHCLVLSLADSDVCDQKCKQTWACQLCL